MMKAIIILFAVLFYTTVYATSEDCIASAGYSWCAFEGKCIRPWELAQEKDLENTPENIETYCNLKKNSTVGIGSKDEHGCVPSAGYSWCSKENKCIRPWELASQVGIATTPESINAYCAACSVSAGYSWCEKEMKCVRPWELATLKNIANTPESFEAYCSSKTVSHPVIGGGSDSHGCIAMAGYIWCETENKCVRPWELSKEKDFGNTRDNVQAYCSGTVPQAPEVHTQKRVGGESDSHGCIAGAGYSWCAKESKCVRPWELAQAQNIENSPSAFQSYCNVPAVGGASDSHGCVAGAGYSWCAKEGKCVRPWELAQAQNIENSPSAFQSYCNVPAVGGASDSHDCVAGAGYSWCAKEGKCVRPWELAQAQNIENSPSAFQSYCNSEAIGGTSDSHGCVAGAGYSWCAKEGKCVRPWELAQAQNIENSPSAFQSYCNSEAIGGAGAHGCVAGAGYTWCAKESACVRPWELARQHSFENSVEGFQQYCSS